MHRTLFRTPISAVDEYHATVSIAGYSHLADSWGQIVTWRNLPHVRELVRQAIRAVSSKPAAAQATVKTVSLRRREYGVDERLF